MLLAAVAFSEPRTPPLVLLVEDHADTRAMYAEFLRMDFEVAEAGDGHRAIEMVRARRPDLVITDLALPGVDGFELIAMMRADADATLRTVPIICLSGYGGLAHDSRARAAGCNRILQKPCMPDTLAAAAHELLQAHQRGGAAS